MNSLQQRRCSHAGASTRLTPATVGTTRRVRAAAAAVDAPAKTKEEAKTALLDLLRYTDRGVRVQTFQRGLIEEAQVAVEGCQPGDLDYSLLAGKWRLLYTTASDVLPILEAEYALSSPLNSTFGLPPLLQVGNIYQRFSSPEEGKVQNIIEVSTPGLVAKKGITFTVGASYDVRSGKRIALVFEDAQLGGVRLSPETEALLAPAMLPRGSLQHMLLLAIREFTLRFQFRTMAQVASQAVTRRDNIAAGYLLTYLDEDMLIGRAIGLGGTFIFTREVEEDGAESS